MTGVQTCALPIYEVHKFCGRPTVTVYILSSLANSETDSTSPVRKPNSMYGYPVTLIFTLCPGHTLPDPLTGNFMVELENHL